MRPPSVQEKTLFLHYMNRSAPHNDFSQSLENFRRFLFPGQYYVAKTCNSTDFVDLFQIVPEVRRIDIYYLMKMKNQPTILHQGNYERTAAQAREMFLSATELRRLALCALTDTMETQKGPSPLCYKHFFHERMTQRGRTFLCCKLHNFLFSPRMFYAIL
jgi:hypothetical protein